jgi:sulfate adenylyltransferase
MNAQEAAQVIKEKKFQGKTFPFPFILAPAGHKNHDVLENAQQGDLLVLMCDHKEVGSIVVDEVFEIDPNIRLQQIYGTDDISHPGVSNTLKRLGKLAICGDFKLTNSHIQATKKVIDKAKQIVDAKHSTAIVMAANPLHRAHERVIRNALSTTDLVTIFLLKPMEEEPLAYAIRYKTLTYFINNFLPKNRVIVVPLEHTYIFAGFNEVIIDIIVTNNYGIDKILIGQYQAGLGLYYDQNMHKSMLENIKGVNIEVELIQEFVYCDLCSTLVSTDSCPHGSHHHIHFDSPSILQLLKMGILPPAMLIRKELSALILAELFPNRFEELGRLYHMILPNDGLLVEHDETDFYLQLMKLYQTTSLT